MNTFDATRTGDLARKGPHGAGIGHRRTPGQPQSDWDPVRRQGRADPQPTGKRLFGG